MATLQHQRITAKANEAGVQFVYVMWSDDQLPRIRLSAPDGSPGHQLTLILARLVDTLDTLPLHEVSPDVPELLSDFFDDKWQQGKLSELWSEAEEAGLLQLLAPYLDGNG